jgi:hypothetical protein
MLGHAALGELALGETTAVVPSVVGERGAFVLSGQSALVHRTGVSAAGAFTLTGQSAGNTVETRPATAVFTLSGSAGLHRGLVLVAKPNVIRSIDQPLFAPLGTLALGQSGDASEQATTFLLRGNNATLRRIVYLRADAGAFDLAGQSVEISRQGYPPNIRIFPRVGRGVRAFGTGRTIETTGTLVWNGETLIWNGEHLNWHGTIYRGGVVVRVVGGRKRETSAESLVWNGGPLVWNGEEFKWQGTSRPKGIRARAFGGLCADAGPQGG